MKSILISLISLLLTTAIFGQKPDVEVYEKKEGDKTLIIARNTGNAESTVKLTITSQGMDVVPSSIVEAKVPAGFMKEMATLTPRPGELWSYSYDVSITQSVSKPTSKQTTTVTPTPSSPKATVTTTANTQQKISTSDPSLSNADIILYAKPGCGRCTFAKKQLTSLGIEFLEIDTHSDSPEVPNMWAQMRSQGFKGGSVTMPVIRVKGQYHYDIPDLGSFISKLKS